MGPLQVPVVRALRVVIPDAVVPRRPGGHLGRRERLLVVGEGPSIDGDARLNFRPNEEIDELDRLLDRAQTSRRAGDEVRLSIEDDWMRRTISAFGAPDPSTTRSGP